MMYLSCPSKSYGKFVEFLRTTFTHAYCCAELASFIWPHIKLKWSSMCKWVRDRFSYISVANFTTNVTQRLTEITRTMLIRTFAFFKNKFLPEFCFSKLKWDKVRKWGKPLWRVNRQYTSINHELPMSIRTLFLLAYIQDKGNNSLYGEIIL